MRHLSYRLFFLVFILIWLAACVEPAPMLTPANDETQLPTETDMPIAPSSPTSKTLPTATPTTLPPASETEGSSQAQDPSAEGGIYFVTDEFDAVAYVIPNEWDEYLASPWQEEDKIIGSTITASSDLGAYLNWGAPGMTISVSNQLGKGYIQMMDEFRDVYAEFCVEHKSRWEYENDFHRGMRQRFWHCGGESGPTLDLLALVDKENPQNYTAMVTIVWFYPVEYQLTEDYILSFMVIPDNLP